MTNTAATDDRLQPDADGLYRGPQVCALAGITYRQLDYWIRCDIITPAVGAKGSGSQRRFSELDVRVLRRLGDVTRVVTRFTPGAFQELADALRTAYPAGQPVTMSATANGHYVVNATDPQPTIALVVAAP